MRVVDGTRARSVMIVRDQTRALPRYSRRRAPSSGGRELLCAGLSK